MLEHLPVNVLLLTFLLGLGWVINDDAKDPVQPVFAFADPAIVESSGLVAQDGLVYTTNDSGDTGRVFAVDPASGETVGVTRWAAEPTDVEALAPGRTRPGLGRRHRGQQRRAATGSRSPGCPWGAATAPCASRPTR